MDMLIEGEVSLAFLASNYLGKEMAGVNHLWSWVADEKSEMILIFIDYVALGNQGDNAFSSVSLSILLSVSF